VREPALLRNLPGDLVGTHRLLSGRLPESKEGAEEGKREGDTKPEAKESKQGGEGNGT